MLRNRGRLWQELGQALATGALAAYGQPGIGCWPLMLAGLLALGFWAARARSFAAAAVLGLGFGLGFFAVVTVAAREWAFLVPAVLTLVGTGLYALPLALWAHAVARRPFGVAAFCATAALWSLCMAAGDYLGFPTKVEEVAALVAWPMLLGGARLFGSNVASGLLMAGILGCSAHLARTKRLSIAGARAAMLPIAAALGSLLLSAAAARQSASAASGTLSVGIPQMNVPGAYFEQRLTLPQLSDAFEDTFAAQLGQLSSLDLLALSETYDGSYPLLVPKVRERFQNYARSQRQAVVLTSYLASAQGGIYNAAGMIDTSGRLVGVHRKVNLAPFGEIEFQAGSTFRPANIMPGVRAGMLICQESFLDVGPFALARAGANVLVSSTSDISFHSGLLSFEHLAMSRLRAIETGRSMIWASAGGTSGASNRWGEFVAGGPFRAPAAVRAEAELHDDTTFYLRSTWFWRALAIVTLLISVWRLTALDPSPKQVLPRRGTVLGIVATLAGLGFVWALAIGSAGAVEIANGTPQRAQRSALELWHRGVPDFGQGSLERFHTDLAHSASGALAYYLDYYGQRTLPSAVTPRAAAPTLHDLAEELRVEQRFPTREVRYDFANPPRVPTLVRTKAGEVCVATTNRSRHVSLFAPTRAEVRELTIDQARLLLEPSALLPGGDHDLGGD